MDNLIDMLKKERMVKGEAKYGRFDPNNDPRNFINECIDELLDSLNYLEMASQKGQLTPELALKISQLLKGAMVILLSAQA
jgi:hypothetical protein